MSVVLRKTVLCKLMWILNINSWTADVLHPDIKYSDMQQFEFLLLSSEISHVSNTTAKQHPGCFLFSKSLPFTWNTRLSNRSTSATKTTDVFNSTLYNVERRGTFFSALLSSQLIPQITKVAAQYGIIILNLSAPFTAATRQIQHTNPKEKKSDILKRLLGLYIIQQTHTVL